MRPHPENLVLGKQIFFLPSSTFQKCRRGEILGQKKTETLLEGERKNIIIPCLSNSGPGYSVHLRYVKIKMTL